MSKPANPLTQGFRAVLRDRAILLAEIVWRWCFGAIAFFLLLGAALMLMSSVTLGANDEFAWRSRDPYLIAEAALRVFDAVGGKLLKISAVVLPAITILWTVLGSAGRTFTLSRLANREVRFRTIFALHCWRAFFLWLAGAALAAAIFFSAEVSSRGTGQPDLFLYYGLVLWSVLLIGGFWATMNWYLSLACVCCARSEAGSIGSFRQAVRFSRANGGDLGGVSLMFAVLRLVAIAIAFVLCALPSRLIGSAPNVYSAWVIVVSLAYFAVADFLYISRFAAYMIVEVPAAEVAGGAVSPEGPVPAGVAPGKSLIESSSGRSRNGF